MSVSVAGPKAASQRSRSTAWAGAVSIGSISAPSQAAVGTQRYWPLTQVVRGRPRTTFRSIASCGRIREPALGVISHFVPTVPNRTRFARTGTDFVRSEVNASPRASSSRSAVAIARRSQAAGCFESSLTAIICSSRLRSRAATARVAAASTTGTSSRGTTNSVRRMPSMRTSVRSSYSSRSMSA